MLPSRLRIMRAADSPTYRAPLQVKRRAADDLEDVGCGSLLLQRLAQFVEQPRVLDGDDGLSGEVLTNSICLSVKGRTSWR